jgi:hypothetical protein
MTVFQINMTEIKNTISNVNELHDYEGVYSSSVLFPEKPTGVKKPNHSWSVLGIATLLSLSAFSDIRSEPNHNSFNSSTYSYTLDVLENKEDLDILLGFISNLINNSEDLDGRIVDMVNNNFWDLI